MTIPVIFFGSFLLFAIQPMLGRVLLPGFGGGAAVWSVCLAAYQALLLAGYFYAHGVSRMARTRQWAIHAAALGLATLWCAGVAALWSGVSDKIGTGASPGLEVLTCVVALVGLPYVLLASGSSLVQSWLAGREARGVYKLYAVSNLGSFAGLFFYPLVVEPFVPLAWQWRGFATGFFLYAALVATLGKKLANNNVEQASRLVSVHDEQDGSPVPRCALPPPLARAWLWVALPGLSSFLLVAVTNHLTLDVTPVPLMWALLLGLFLLSYVAGFSRIGEKGLAALPYVCAACVAGLAWLLVMKGQNNTVFKASLAWGGLGFGGVCVFLHGWLYAIRPSRKESLTRYYLGIAAGGALGGTLGSLVCPLVFPGIWEWPVGLAAAAALAGWFMFASRRKNLAWCNRGAYVALALAMLWLGRSFQWDPARGTPLVAERNFYGTLTLTQRDVTQPGERRQDVFTLTHGRTVHGAQSRKYWEDEPEPPARAHMENAAASAWEGFPVWSVKKRPLEYPPAATTYYGPAGGGAAVETRRASKGSNAVLRVGLVGLGAGTMAAWGREGDFFRFYEINPAVPPIALDDRHFTFLTASAADVEIVIGDARKILEAEEKAKFERWDVLVVDAYSGDSIPFHLATREAFELYRGRLAEGGILAVHLSNWHMDLLPLVKAVAEETGMSVRGVFSGKRGELESASWAFLAEDAFDLAAPGGREVEWANVDALRRVPTDTLGSLIPLVRLRNTHPDEILKKPARANFLLKSLGVETD